MGLHVEGWLAAKDISEFARQCEKIGWVVVGHPTEKSSEFEYLDKSMNKHKLLIGKKTDLVMIGH